MLKMTNEEYIEIRNKAILELKEVNLRSTDISKLQVQHISRDFFMVVVWRGKSLIRVAIKPTTSYFLQLLTEYKDDKDFIFTSPVNPDKALTRQAIDKIIAKGLEHF